MLAQALDVSKGVIIDDSTGVIIGVGTGIKFQQKSYNRC